MEIGPFSASLRSALVDGKLGTDAAMWSFVQFGYSLDGGVCLVEM